MIYVLGGLGFVGSAFVRYFTEMGIECAAVDKDNYADFVGTHCDILVNANGNSKKFLATENPMLEFEQTVRSVRASLVDFATEYYVHLSTCDVYPDCSSPEKTQEDRAIDFPKQSAYGFHKYLAEHCVQRFAPKWLIIRMGGFVGPGLKKNPIFDILHGGPLWLDPESQLQYLNTDKNAELIYKLIQLGISGETVNLCGQGLVQLGEVIKLVGKPVEVKPNSPKVRYDVSISKVSQWLSVPDSREIVMDYVDKELHPIT